MENVFSRQPTRNTQHDTQYNDTLCRHLFELLIFQIQKLSLEVFTSADIKGQALKGVRFFKSVTIQITVLTCVTTCKR